MTNFEICHYMAEICHSMTKFLPPNCHFAHRVTLLILTLTTTSEFSNFFLTHYDFFLTSALFLISSLTSTLGTDFDFNFDFVLTLFVALISTLT
jgi:hypothetical protein